jgi:NADH:ubiquinone oxidoreductase subunit 3 (subunit A)
VWVKHESVLQYLNRNIVFVVWETIASFMTLTAGHRAAITHAGMLSLSVLVAFLIHTYTLESGFCSSVFLAFIP